MQENHRAHPAFSIAAALLALLLHPGDAPADAPGNGPGNAPADAPADAPRAAEPPEVPEPPSFARSVAPIFQRWCVSCHGAREQQASLRLDRYEAVFAGGDSGPPVIAGDPATSLLVAKIERRDRPAMPPRKRLPKAAVTAIRAWIAAGAAP